MMLRALGFPRSPSRWARAQTLRCCLISPVRERRGLASRAMMPVPLSYAIFDGPSPDPPLVFLHGLFGSKSNFSSLAKKLVLQTGRKVLTVDARNHGDSSHSPIMTYEAMSADIHLFLHQLHLSRCVLIGHSMGGKTAMVFTLQWPELVERLVCVDISPSQTKDISGFQDFIAAMRAVDIPRELVERLVCVDISPSQTKDISGFQDFIAAMRAVDIPRGIPRSTARRLAEEQLRPSIQEPTILYFLLTNLVNSEDQFVWRVNLEAISQHLNELMSFPDFQTSYLGPTLFLGGSKSGYISSHNYPEIKQLFPDAEIQHVPDAGHWVHADQPQKFITAICNFLALHPI